MLNIDDNGLFEVFPMIETISKSFEYQNSMLNKIVLTGKINALEIAENLFNFTEQTAQTFAELQSKLILHLLEENKKELLNKAKIKSRTISNFLSKSLYLRGLDIELLSKDITIIEFLQKKITKSELSKKLDLYLSQHPIYNDIIILSKENNVLFNINSKNKVKSSKDEILSQALKKDTFVQQYKKTDLYLLQKDSLIFVKKIEDEDGNILGNIVMVYDIKHELANMISDIISSKETIVVVDKYHNILYSTEKGLDKGFVKKINKIDQIMIVNNRFFYKTKAKMKENLEDVYVIVSYNKREDINIVAEFNDETANNRELTNISLNNKELKKLADDGYEILEDLSDVIINGELIAAKSKQYILIPILDNLREVSFKVVKLIELSISSLQKIIETSIVNNVQLISKMFIDLLVRNLYERMNDLKWWAQDDVLKEAVANKQTTDKLKFLNELYPMFSDIFIYDKEGNIIDISNSHSFISQSIEHNYTFSNHDENKSYISPFVNSKLYNNQPTFIIYATILKDDEVIGGIGAVFDSLNEFHQMLNISFDSESGIGLIIDSHRKIISSSDENFKVLDEFELIDASELKQDIVKDIKFKDKMYKVAITKAKEYRGYELDLYSVIMMEK
jgi:hypothetical protein